MSGEHIADRLEFQKLMRKVEAGEYAGILVHEVSRLGRGEAMEYGYVLFTLRRTGTLFKWKCSYRTWSWGTFGGGSPTAADHVLKWAAS